MVDWAVLHHLSIKKMINSNATGQCGGENCSLKFFFPDYLVWIKSTNTKQERRLSFHCNLVFNVKKKKEKKKTLSISLYSLSDCLHLKHYMWVYFPFIHCFIYGMTTLWLYSPRIMIQFWFRNRWPLFH